MVVTRSQTRSQSKLQKEIVTHKQQQQLLERKEFVDNMKGMLKDFENKRGGDMSERMKSIIPIFEYNNRMLQKFDEPCMTMYIKCVYEKCSEFQKEHNSGLYDKLDYRLVCNFLQILKSCQDICQQLIAKNNK